MKKIILLASTLFIAVLLPTTGARAEDSIPAATLAHQYHANPVSSKVAARKAAPEESNFFPEPEKWQPLEASFSLQSDMLFSREKDETLNSWRGNSYIDGVLRNNYIEIGARFEELLRPLPGRSAIESGRDLPFAYFSARYGNMAEITVGDFYDRFGSGIIFRAYEDRALGIDNAVRGIKVNIKPWKGITLKALWGQQRYTFDRTFKLFNEERGYVSGGDLDFNISEWVKPMQDAGMLLSIGASAVSKQEQDEDIFVVRDEKNYRLNLPKSVPAYGGRLDFSYRGFVLNGEYAVKPNDPTAENNYIYHRGSVGMLSASYSQDGFSALFQVKRSENFNYASKRSLLGIHLRINHMPPFSAQHTYALAALYPYATQPEGEWAFQGEARYNFARGTTLGGKYGTTVKVNASHIRGLKREVLEDVDIKVPTTLYGTDGYKASTFGMGDLFFSDVNIEIAKKVTREFNFSFTYLHQIYNQKVVEGHVINELQQTPHIWSNTFIFDGTYKFSKKVALRTELQFLATRQGEGNWIYGLAEVSLSPGWMLSVSDQYNAGKTKQHYYMGSVAYTKGAHRVALSFGRTRAGMNCSGGVCRWMPQTRGIYFSYNGNF